MSQGDGEVLTELSPENWPLPTGFIHGRQRQARGDLHLEKCVQLFPEDPTQRTPPTQRVIPQLLRLACSGKQTWSGLSVEGAKRPGCMRSGLVDRSLWATTAQL